MILRRPPFVAAGGLHRLVWGLAAILLVLVVAAAIAIHLVDSGRLNARIERWASARLRRPVHVGAVHFHLLSRDLTLVIDRLVIENPGWLHGGDLAEVDHIVAHVRLVPLLSGDVRADAIAVDGLHLHLIRFAPGRNNWTFAEHPRPGPAFAPLASTSSLSIAPATIDVRDYGRKLLLAGRFVHRATGPRPFALAAQGTLGGYAVALTATGGPINGPGVGPPWPFHADLVDAATRVGAQGVTGQPFDLTRFDLGLAASGPNLADIGYLFDLATPNSAPFHVHLRARTDGRHFGFSNIEGMVGRSDVTGSIRSDHGGARRRLIATFRSHAIDRADVDALLSTAPPRAEARAKSGAVTGVATGRWLLPDAPFGLTRLRATDFALSVQADRATGYAVPLRDVATRIVADEGLLRFPAFQASLYGGRLAAHGDLDARQDLPRIAVQATLRGAHVAAIVPGQPPVALIDAAAEMTGSGISVHAAAGRSTGRLALRVTGASVPRRAAWILGGDLLRAIGNVGGKGLPASLPVSCAAIALDAPNAGVLHVTGLGIATPLGRAGGSGTIDLGRERLSLLLQGHPARKRIGGIAVPIRIEGPLLAPKLTILPGSGARALGLKGTPGLVLTPIAGLLPVKRQGVRIPEAPMLGCDRLP